MAKHFVYKEIFTSKYICNGKAVDFEPLDGNSGVAVFEDGKDDEVIKCLQHAAGKHMGGIVFINEEEYNKKKAERPWIESEQRSKLERLRVLPHRPFGLKEPGVVAPEVAQAVKEAPPMTTPSTPAANLVASPVGETQLPMNSEPPKFKPATKRVAKEAAKTT